MLTDITKIKLLKVEARNVLRHLLQIDEDKSDQYLKRAYKKVVLHIHPDKFKLKSGERAFVMVSTAYGEADL